MLSGCSSAVDVSVPGGAGAPACASAAWPTTVSGMDRRDTDPADPAVAAWGDPAVVARCGVAAPGPTDTECVEVDGVGWIPEALSDGTRFTSFGTEPAVEVLVPGDYDPAPLLLPAFDAVAKALPRNGLECR
ncbi:DUF3515 family protein [Phycicoccus sonneratiae]|uniref:DUF3515 family protein n=1 Tax=Phycicoccus sonneratiae TaxID=2807628 RepID=A0ABS2CKS4_9MICO|nr:DUF3515 family protein [Phycicoccus sonneraticus]MBM6400476.1 DUF3515 family protein [Phycicoccus sonneraticus]